MRKYLYNILYKIVSKYNKNIRFPTYTNILHEDWDNLVILDACRYDMFNELDDLSGESRSVISVGSSTKEFLQETFKDQEYPEIVYISANANITYVDSKFHKRIRLWETDWDSELNTVHPKAITSKTLETQESYPNKKLIIHFMQPHYPFIGETGRTIEHKGQFDPETKSRIWTKLENNDINEDLVWKSYRENLDLTVPFLTELLENLSGKSVVTSDHGNEFGKYGIYGHPSGKYTINLRKVPWFESYNKPRKEIKKGNATDGPIEKERAVKEKLAALGYVDELD